MEPPPAIFWGVSVIRLPRRLPLLTIFIRILCWWGIWALCLSPTVDSNLAQSARAAQRGAVVSPLFTMLCVVFRQAHFLLDFLLCYLDCCSSHQAYLLRRSQRRASSSSCLTEQNLRLPTPGRITKSTSTRPPSSYHSPAHCTDPFLPGSSDPYCWIGLYTDLTKGLMENKRSRARHNKHYTYFAQSLLLYI